ncbi:MAG TPA: NADH-quinone oxidoreductase subunit NuoG [bacterium]|nr:NADH-quinone oxidoreductase subunit NuoG [bacterium]
MSRAAADPPPAPDSRGVVLRPGPSTGQGTEATRRLDWPAAAPPGPAVPMVHLTIDGRTVAVPKGTTVWQAARQIGIEIPVFCYHDRMPPLGACRMCFVEVEKMPKLATSCTLEALEDMVVRTATERVKQGQRGILEFLLVNHPLDCPICDKGGECPLQDNTLKFGPGASRFVETKRTYGKHVRMGSVLVLDRERCVLCWRCVRFGELVAGDDALKGFERGYHSQIATPFMEPVESKFIGNTIAICPVGALTSATYRFRSRPWDIRQHESVCAHCGCGCATTLDVRDNDLTRTRAREHPEINDVWLCDKGFFGYEFTGSRDRLRTPLVRDGGALRDATWDEALDRVAEAVRRTPSDRIGVIGGARGTNEDAYLLTRVFRGIVGTNSIDFRDDTAFPLPAAEAPWGLGRPISDVEHADVIVLLGCDLTEEYPIIWLRVKKAVDRGARLVIANPWALEIARWARHNITYRRGSEPAILEALAGGGAPPPDGGRPDGASRASDVDAAALRDVAALLAAAERPLVLAGHTALEQPEGRAVVASLHALGAAYPAVTTGLLRGRGNAGGAQSLGVLPDLLPGYRPLADAAARASVEAVWGRPIPAAPGRTVREMLAGARDGRVVMLYVVGADPATSYPDAAAWRAARERLDVLVVHDAFLTATAAAADVVLPVLTSAEKSGTVGNLEGRVQHQAQAVVGPGEARSDSAILSALAARLGVPLAFSSWEEVTSEIARLIPGWAPDARIAPPPIAPAAMVPVPAPAPGRGEAAPHDGALVLLAGTKLFDRGTMALRCPGVRAQAGEPFVALHPGDAGRLGLAEGSVCEVRSARGALRLPVRLWPGLHPGHAYVPRGFDAAPVTALLDEREAVWVTVHALASLVPPAGPAPRRGQAGAAG